MPRRCNPAAPTLFLDFDGVLHPDEVYRVGGKIVLKLHGFALFEWAPLLDDILAPYPGLQVVLATSWVRVLGFDAACAWLTEGLQERVVGATWHGHEREGWEHLTRFDQIHRNVLRHGYQRWLAVDDDDIGWPDERRDKLVLTNSMLGLDAATAQQDLREKLLALHR